MTKTKKKCLHFINSKKTQKNKDIVKLKHYNKIAKSYLDKTLIKKLVKEFASRTTTTKELPAVKFNRYKYSFEVLKNESHRRLFVYDKNKKHCLIDFEKLSKKHSLFIVDDFCIANNEQYVLYNTDTIGNNLFNLYLKSYFNNNSTLIAKNTTGNACFSPDSQYIYYIKYDMGDLRPSKLYIYNICNNSHKLIFEEHDRTKSLSLQQTSDRMYIILNNDDYYKTTPYIVYIDKIVQAYKSKKNMLIHIDHWMNKWYILKKTHNSSELLSSDNLTHFNIIIPNQSGTIIDNDMIIKANNIIFTIKTDNKRELVIYNIFSKNKRIISLSNNKYSIIFSHIYNLNIYEPDLTLAYSSFINPEKIIKINLDSFKIKLLDNFTPKNYLPSKYQQKIININKNVSITIISTKNSSLKNKKCLLNGYGSYGVNIEPSFDSNNISLLDRDIIICYAHIRGSSIKGYNSWLDGKMLSKKNTFIDFIDAANWLIDKNITSSEKLTIWGRSAGGLLIGSVINYKPKLANLAILGVPFVDVINTLSDSCQPLTTEEWKEWGNPANKKYYKYIKSYDPIKNIDFNLDYPNLYIYSNLHDTLVPYKQVLNYYEKIKKSNVFTDKEKFALLHTKLKYGHTQATDKSEIRNEQAEIFSMIIKY